MNKKILTKFVLMVLCFLFTGCANKQNYNYKNNKPIIGIVTKSADSEYWMSLVSGMKMAADELDIKTIFFSPETESEKEVQDRLVESLLINKIDALAVSPIDSYSEPDYISQAREMTVPVISFDMCFEGTKIPYIGVDNELVGYELGKELAKQMGHKGQAGIIAGDLRQSGHRQRVDGFMNYMKTEKNIEIVFIESGYANLQMSEKKVRKILKDYPMVKGIFATSAVTALGIAQEIDGNKVKIVTVDEQKDVLDAIEQNKIAAVANQSGYRIGYETVQYIHQILEGKELETEVLLPVQIITKANLLDYMSNSQEEYLQ